MKRYARIDTETGNFIEDVLFDDGVIPTDSNIIMVDVPEGFHLPKWDGTQWVEGKTDAELLAIAINNKLAELQNAAMTALATFQSTALGTMHTYLSGITDMIYLESEDRFMNSADYDNQPILWYTVENGDVSHSKEQIHSVYLDGRSAVQNKKYKVKSTLAQIQTATDVASVNAIDIAGIDWNSA